jgi:transitional endoplasmic reticulum ATPase
MASSRSVTLPAARPKPDHGHLDLDKVVLPAGVCADLGLEPGVVVGLSAADQLLYARVMPVAGGDAVYLRGEQWAQLRVRPGDPISVSPAYPAVAEDVALVPPVHLSETLGRRIGEQLRRTAAVVWPGARLPLPVMHGGGLITVEVARASEPVATVGDQTTVIFTQPAPEVGRRPVSYADIGGLVEVITRIREVVELPLTRPGLYRALGVTPTRGVLLHGPPGTGKTLLCRAVASSISAKVITLSAPELVGSFTGETEANLRRLFADAANLAPALVIIDEIDVLAASRSSLASHGDVRIASQLLTLMDGLDAVDGVLVIGTTNRLSVVDPAFRRPGRFDEEIAIDPPNAAARAEIFDIHTRTMALTPAAERTLKHAIARRTGGFTGADLMRLARELGIAAVRRSGSAATDGWLPGGALPVIEEDDVAHALASVSPSALRELDSQPHLSWERLVGMRAERAALLDAAKHAFSGAKQPRDSVLLTGPPGNGKSALVSALATYLHANLVRVDGATIFTQWLGESEATLRAMFAKARQLAPAVLAIENLDAIAPARIGGELDRADRRVLAALLACLDDTVPRGGVLVVGLTDRADLVDAAALRTGRLGTRVEVSAPDAPERLALLEAVLGGEASEDTLTALVARTEGQSRAKVLHMARANRERTEKEAR